jgi:hypothetical protein
MEGYCLTGQSPQRAVVPTEEEAEDDARTYKFKPLNAELNPICHLLALLVVHHILHVSRIGVKPITDV